MSLSTDELKQREISQSYLNIEQNTQLLQEMRRVDFSTKRSLVDDRHFSQIDPKIMFKLLVQHSYLLYSCLIQRQNIHISHRICCAERKDRSNGREEITSLYVEYILSAQAVGLTGEQADYIKNDFEEYLLEKSDSAFGNFLLRDLKRYIKLLQISADPECSILVAFKKVFFDHLEPLAVQLRPQIIIRILEETQLFRQNSTILRVNNASLYSAIYESKKQKAILKRIQELGVQPNVSIADSLSKLFQLFLDQNIFQKMTIERNDESKKIPLLTLRATVRQKPFYEFDHRRLTAIMEGSAMACQSSQAVPVANPPPAGPQILFEYDPKTCLVTAKYLSASSLPVQTAAMTLLQCNNISINMTPIRVELVHRKDIEKRNCLCFKSRASLEKEQGTTCVKATLLLETVIACGKIMEIELKRLGNSFEDHQKIQRASQQFNHMGHTVKKLYQIYSKKL